MKQKKLGKYLVQIFSFIKGQYLAKIKIQIVKQIGCVDATLVGWINVFKEDPSTGRQAGRQAGRQPSVSQSVSQSVSH